MVPALLSQLVNISLAEKPLRCFRPSVPLSTKSAEGWGCAMPGNQTSMRAAPMQPVASLLGLEMGMF